MRFNKLVLALPILLACLLSGRSNGTDTVLESIETIAYKDSNEVEHEEYAFRAPMKGIPESILEVYCANIKLRLYWNVYRQQVKESRGRTENLLRRLGRMARHTFDEIRDVDDPFQAKRLSVIDKHFPVPEYEPNDERKREPIKMADTLKAIRRKFRFHSSNNSKVQSQLAEFDIENIDDRGPQGKLIQRLKSAYRFYAPKVKMGVYTRWSTMWWLTMPCIYTKYYLWDPALDEFTKLKRSLVMYPDLLQLRLQDVECKPVKFFQRILDVCKILNPLMHISFGQLSLDQMIRFKSDRIKD